MQSLVIRPRWLVLSGVLVAVLLVLSLSTGMALGSTPAGPTRAGGFAASGQGACNPAGFGGPQFAASVLTDPATAIAGALSLSMGQLQQALSSGATLNQILTAHGMTSRQVIDSVTSGQKDQLDPQVANGRITLDQETAMLASEQARIDDVLSGKTPLSMPAAPARGLGQSSRGRGQNCGG